uniref:Leucine-rich repeats and IQ motif containing 1 n=1 Tax=Anabas testudineus TaxID=64144 RepID=A0AAQ6ISM0_ANATE
MTDANVTDLKLNDLFISDTDETKDEKSFSFDKEAATEEIPPSLISYFETSKSRASVCEKLILEELDDFTTSYEDTMNLHIALNEDMELNEQGVCETRNENNTSTDSFLLPTPTDTEAHGTHNLSVCTNNEDKTDTDEHMESGKHLTFRTSLIDKEIKENSEWQREHTENQHFEEMKKEERVRQRENDFQEELNKLMEAEKLHQVELQLMEKRAQEKLEHELLLQQELISNLQKHVEEERRMIDEEIKRIKEEEEKKKKEKEEKKKREEEDMKKREEEKIKRQMQRERMEEERRRANEEEENRKIKEIKEEEERRNKEEEQRKKKEEEEKRKREEEKNKMQKEIRKKEEERKKEIRLKEEEKRRQMEEEERKIKGMENNIKVKEKNKEEETMKKEQEKTVIKVTGKKMEGDKKRKNEEEESLDEEGLRKKEWRIRAEEDKTKEADVKIAEELEMKTQQEEKKEEGKSEEERKEAEIEKMMDKEMRKKEEKMSNIGNEVQLTENKEKRKKDVDGRHNIENKYRRMEEEKITKEEEWKKSQGEEMKRHKNVKDEYRKIEEEISLKEGNKTYEADKEKRHEHEKLEKDGTRKKEGGVINTEADERQMKEEVNETKAGNIKTEGKGLEEEEESKMIIVKETVEKEEKRANDLQEKNLIENDCTNTTDERNNTARTGNSLTSQLEDNSICTSSGPGPLYSDSISFETAQRGDQEMNIIETYTNKTMDQQDAAGKLCTSPSSLLWCLPEDTEQKRLSWMKYCIPWSKLSLQNRRKHKGSVRSQRLPRRAAEASSLPPLCPDTLLQSTGCKSLQELTTVTLEDLPGCSLSTLVQCTQLRSLSLRRCGLKSLEGISQLSKLCYIDVEENEISFVNCENMTSLRVLRLGHNKLTSIHGLSGADNLDVLELSHNNITRIAGLESMRKLQRLSVDHNQLISTKGLRDVYTLLHLNCSHNHLTSVEGLENSSSAQHTGT